MRSFSFVAVVAMVAFLAACGGSGSTPAPTDSGIKVVGSVEGLAASVAAPPVMASKSVAKASFDADPSCETESFNITPTAYRVRFKRVTLLGSSSTGTADFDLINVASVDDATEVDFVTNSTFTESTSYPPAGTYDGIQVEVFYIGEAVQMAVPAVNEATGAETFAVDSYLLRGYFADVGNVQPRDVTLFADPGTGTEAEYWIDRDTFGSDPYGLVSVASSHPNAVLDLWHDPNFWCENGTWTPAGCTEGWRTPMSICTRTTAECDSSLFGTDFTFAMADGTGELVIPADATGLYTITFAFDVADKFNFWGDTNYPNAADAYGTFRVGYDCGIRIFFPDVTISFSKS